MMSHLRRASLLALLFGLLASLCGEEQVLQQVTVPWKNSVLGIPLVTVWESSVDTEIRFTVSSDDVDEGFTVTDRVVLPAGVRVTHQTALPASTEGHFWTNLRWQSSQGMRGSQYANTHHGDDAVSVFVIDADGAMDRRDLRERVDGITTDGRSGELIDIESSVVPQSWHLLPDWACIVISPTAEAQLRPGQRQALARWHRLTDALFVARPEQLANWRSVEVTPHLLTDDNQLEATMQRLVAAWIHTQENEPVPGTEEVPVLGFLILVILVSVIIGPVNYLWARKRGQPALLLISTPLISACAVLALVVLGMFVDGLTRQRAVTRVTWLDQEAHQAVIATHAAYFGTFAADAFALGPTTYLRVSQEDPHDQVHTHRISFSTSSSSGDQQVIVSLDHTGGNTVAQAGWVPARQQRSLDFLSIQPERRRLQLIATEAGYRLTNQLDVALEQVFWRDAENRVWRGQQIAAGATVDLARYDETWEDDLLQRQLQSPALMTDDQKPDEPGRLEELLLPGLVKSRLRSILEPYGLIARCAAPLHQVPGPPAEDARPVESWLAMTLPPDTEGGP